MACHPSPPSLFSTGRDEVGATVSQPEAFETDLGGEAAMARFCDKGRPQA